MEDSGQGLAGEKADSRTQRTQKGYLKDAKNTFKGFRFLFASSA
jgi:hypothetical protein